MMMNVQLEQLVEYTWISHWYAASVTLSWSVRRVHMSESCLSAFKSHHSFSLSLSQLIYIQLKPSQSRTHTLLSYQGFHRNRRQYKFNREP